MSPLEREWEKRRLLHFKSAGVYRIDHGTIIRRLFVKAPWYVRLARWIRRKTFGAIK